MGRCNLPPPRDLYTPCAFSPTRKGSIRTSNGWLLTHGPDTLPAQRPGHCNTQASFTPCNHIPSRVPARLSPTRSTGGHPLYTDRPPSTGTASVTGPGSAQADSDPKTSLSRPLALTWNWSTVLTLIRSHPPTSWMPMVTMSESDPIQRQENRCQFCKSYDALPRHHDERLKPRGRPRM